MNKLISLIVIFTSLLFTACGGSAPEPPSVTDVLNSYELTSFSVEGTSGDTPEGLAPIDPQTNGGEFLLRWTVREALQNSIRLIVSEDNNLSDDDVEIYFFICNIATFCGQAQVRMPCEFDTDDVMECGLLIKESAFLTSFLDTIPKDAFIIIESCLNGFPLLCDTRSDGVQFQ